jgi:uncharacterized phage-associated protein
MQAVQFAAWVAAACDARGIPYTQLKLQKLCFYAYGVAASANAEGELGAIEFEAWKHGPVLRPLWEALNPFKAEPIPPGSVGVAVPTYSDATTEHLSDAIDVYGRLDAWALREESHLEKPWRDLENNLPSVISSNEIRKHFLAKFEHGKVEPPQNFGLAGNFELDGIPSKFRFKTFGELASFVRHLPRA